MSLGIWVFLIFLVLKLAEIGVAATWSWWLVFLPLVIEAAIDFGILYVYWRIFKAQRETQREAFRRSLR